MAPYNKHKEPKYISLGSDWVQIDATREGLFAFVMEIRAGQEPAIKTVALTIPNIAGQGDPNQTLYAVRYMDKASQLPMVPQPIVTPAPILPEATRQPGLSIVKPEEGIEVEVEAEEESGIPARRDQGSSE